MGLIPPIPETLYKAAEEGHAAFGLALMDFVAKNRRPSGHAVHPR